MVFHTGGSSCKKHFKKFFSKEGKHKNEILSKKGQRLKKFLFCFCSMCLCLREWPISKVNSWICGKYESGAWDIFCKTGVWALVPFQLCVLYWLSRTAAVLPAWSLSVSLKDITLHHSGQPWWDNQYKYLFFFLLIVPAISI